MVGLDQGGAEVALMAAGLEPVIIDSLYNADGEPGAVVEQDPAAGVEVKGTRNVYLTVYRSTPPSERLEIEEGMDAGVARILLDVKGFPFRERYAPTEDLAGLVLGWKVPEATPLARMTGFRRGPNSCWSSESARSGRWPCRTSWGCLLLMPFGQWKMPGCCPAVGAGQGRPRTEWTAPVLLFPVKFGVCTGPSSAGRI